MDTMLNAIEEEEKSTKKIVEGDMSNVEQIVNIILDDVLSNTYSFLQLKPNFHGWRQ
jgi:hypothetical protein